MGYFSGIYTGIKYESFPIRNGIYGITDAQAVDEFILSKTVGNQFDNIIAIFMIPTAFWTAPQGQDKFIEPIKYYQHCTMTHDVDAYQPRNRKLLTFPYKFLTVDTISDAQIYKYELSRRFDEGGTKEVLIEMSCAYAPNPQIVCAPVQYDYTYAKDGEELDSDMPNYTVSVSSSPFPQCSYAIDAYKAWLAQNGNGVVPALSMIGSAGGAGVGIALGVAASNPVTGTIGAIGAGVVGAVGIAKSIEDIAIAKSKGAMSRGSQTGGSLLGSRHLGAYFKDMSIRGQQARIIDDFFDRYGYATERIKVPNRNVRPNWTYTKTRDCSIHGNLPAEAIVKLKSIYDKGITFWKSTSNIGDYSQDNTV